MGEAYLGFFFHILHRLQRPVHLVATLFRFAHKDSSQDPQKTYVGLGLLFNVFYASRLTDISSHVWRYDLVVIEGHGHAGATLSHTS